MSAAVRIEGTAWQDPRFALLGALLGVPDEFAVEVAVGRMAKLWAWCTEKNQLVISERIVCTILRSNSGADALVDAELGRREEGGIYVSGTRGRVEWLSKLRTNGKKGGRPKGKKDKTKRLPKPEPDANQTRTRTEPEPNPLTLTPTLTLSYSPSENNLSAKRKRSPTPQKAPEGYREFVAHFDQRYRQAHGGSKPTWGAAQGKNAKRLLTAHGLAECVKRCDVLFDAPPGWMTSRDFNTLVQHFDKLASPQQRQIGAGHYKVTGDEVYRDGEVAL